MSSINRRKFIKSTSGLLALAAMDLSMTGCASNGDYSLAPKMSIAPKGPNDRLNVAVLGLNGRGGSHLRNFNAAKNCQITYVCDPDTAQADDAIQAAQRSNGEGGSPTKFETDMRRIFDDKSVDIVSIATPNHWHSLATIWAMQAGKDVYVEKPMSFTFTEGKRVAEISAKTGRVVQAGTQMRSMPSIMEAVAYVHSGKLGKMLVSRGLCYKTRNSIGKVDGPQAPPSSVDYNLWAGPSPMSPIMRQKFHYDWHWQWDCGNGDIGNQGIHEIDLARWFGGIDTYPKSVFSVGGRFGYVDDGTTPNTQVSELDFGPDKPKVVIEVRGLYTQAYNQRGIENVIECENGWVVSPSYSSAIAYDKDGKEIQRWQGGGEGLHFSNFIDVVRSRDTKAQHMPASEGHLSDAILHFANISFHTGKPMSLADYRKAPTDKDPDASKAVERMIDHLAANEVSLDTKMSVGRRLNFDAKALKFTGDAQATAMLTREYRAPFTLPKA